MTRTMWSAAAVLALAAALTACGQDAPPAGEDAAAAAADAADQDADANIAADSEAPAPAAGAIDMAAGAPPAERTLAEASAFLAANADREEVTLTASGLQYEVLDSGPSGASSPTLQDWVCVDFTGSLPGGAVFDSTEGAAPLPLPLSGLIDGWREALPLMAEGDSWRLFVPPSLGYGAQGAQDGAGETVIPPNSALIFDITLHRVMRPQDIAIMPDQRVNPDWNCAMPAAPADGGDAAADPQQSEED
jgi:FKBP-type peptidyl-prolyl cis-trans isomerase FklB